MNKNAKRDQTFPAAKLFSPYRCRHAYPNPVRANRWGNLFARNVDIPSRWIARGRHAAHRQSSSLINLKGSWMGGRGAREAKGNGRTEGEGDGHVTKNRHGKSDREGWTEPGRPSSLTHLVANKCARRAFSAWRLYHDARLCEDIGSWPGIVRDSGRWPAPKLLHGARVYVHTTTKDPYTSS